MGRENYGETQKTSRGCQSSITSSQSTGLGDVKESSGIYGTEQDRFDYFDCSGENPFGETQQREHSFGKILERLKLIEREYLSYVKGHQERLEARLDESKEKEEGFKRAVQELEQEIYNLISMQERQLIGEKQREDDCL